MAELADYGLVIWDGKSAGSIANVLELTRQNKVAVVYLAPSKEFLTLRSRSDTDQLLALCKVEHRAQPIETRIQQPAPQVALDF